MKNRKLLILGAAVLASVALVPMATALGNDTDPPAQAVEGLTALGNGFSYQGRLTDGGNPANGNYDLRFVLYDADVGGAQVGNTITLTNIPVTNGLFTVTLDFGTVSATATATATTSPSPTATTTNVWDGNARWIEIAVRTAGGSSFTVLNPRQTVSPAPYALYAKAAGGFALPYTASGNTSATAGAVDITQTGAGIAVAGRNTSSNSPAIYGVNGGTGAGVQGENTNAGGVGVAGFGTVAGATGGLFAGGPGGGNAIEIQGPIKVSGSAPAAFQLSTNTGTLCASSKAIIVTPNVTSATAMLFVTAVNKASAAATTAPPLGVVYNLTGCTGGTNKWAVYTLDGTTLPADLTINVLVINQ